MRSFILLGIILFFPLFVKSQMVNGSEIKYGNEWIKLDKNYFKIHIVEDGIYRINYQQLVDSGIAANEIEGSKYQLFAYGKEIPIHTSTNGVFSQQDFIEFYGEKNRSQLDSFLYRKKEDIFNPEYSMFNDTASYFLTWDNTPSTFRYGSLENDLSGSLPSAKPYYFHIEKMVYTSDFIKPLRDVTNHVYRSNFDVGEGFGSPFQIENNFTITTSNYYESGQKPELNFRIATNTGKHIIEFSVNNTLIKKHVDSGFVCKNVKLLLNSSNISSTMNIKALGTNDSDLYDRSSVSVLSLKYARAFKFQNKSSFEFHIENSNFSEYIEIEDFDIQGSSFVLYDLTNNKRLIPVIDNQSKKVKFLLKPSPYSRRFLLVNLNKSAKLISGLKKMNFKNFSESFDKNYLIITDKEKFNDANKVNWVEEYVKYRESGDGGNFKSLIVDVDDIYDQFGYGIERHSQALNNFIIYYKNFFQNPEYVFIIGKGLQYDEIRTNQDLEEHKNIFVIPTFGYPGSDNLLAAEYNKNHASLAIGRLAAKNQSDIQTYLNKVKKHDTYRNNDQSVEEKYWMKKIVHLVGGDASVIEGIRNSLKQMSNIITGIKFGANVITYERTSGTAQESVTERIVKEIEDGASIVTFYGHSGVTGDDFKIAHLNNDKFPVFFSLGCYSGNIHTTVNDGQSEDFIISDNFMVGYAGTSGTGFTSALNNTGRTLYQLIGNTMYGEGIGKIIQKAIELNDNNDYDATVTLNQQFTYHGDPAVKLYNHTGPDYIIDYQSVKINPSVVNSNEENFTLNFDVYNIGSAVSDSLDIKFVRTFPDGKTETLSKRYLSPKSSATFTKDFKTYHSAGTGENCIAIYLNPEKLINELPKPVAENNNELENQNGENKYCFYIINNGIQAIYPEEFSIVNKSDVELRASTYNYFVNDEKYVFEIDTTELFNSTLKKSIKITTKGGMLTWKPDIQYTHSTVYYWRISTDSISPQLPYNWQYSSFIYLPNSSEGWNQSHYYQWLKYEPKGILVNEKREFVFEQFLISLRILAKKYDPTNEKIAFLDGESWGTLNPISQRPCITIVGFGPKKINTFTGFNYGNLPGGENYAFYFKMENIEQRQGIKKLLEDMPDSSIVLIYTVLGDEGQSLYPELWKNDSITLGYNFFSILEKYGAQNIRLMEAKGTVPYLFVFKKGSDVMFEKIGKTFNDKIEVEFPAPLSYVGGRLISKVIGPATKWNKVLWNESKKELGEKSFLRLFKLDSGFIPDSKIDTINSIYEYDISSIDPKIFPFLQVQLVSRDDKERTPINLDFWRVLYEGLPDAVLVNDESSYFYRDTLDFGDKFKFRSKVYNHTSQDMDSLLVRFKIKKQDNQEIIQMKRYQPLKAGTEYFIDFEHPSSDLGGMNEFTVEINADKEQTEKYYFNNIGIRRFFVRQDDRNPIMDVTFDGIHILDGDIINPKPEIKILVKDENKYLLLNDISIIKKLTLISPLGNIENIQLTNNNLIEFIPAQSLDDNKAHLNFLPDFKEEGTYQLIVQTSDMSGNLSGQNEYKISFQVIFKEQISDVYNYPNPFSTKTRFIFSLTGIQVPEDIVIKIMTLSGKVVRELTSIDLGSFKIGQNISEKYWDGTDEFGTPLANGIYLYKVKAVNSQGKEFEHMESDSETSKFFKEGFGKLVIMR